LARKPRSDGTHEDSTAERLLRKYKGFANSVKADATRNTSSWGDKIQICLSKTWLEEFNRRLKDGWKLDGGQVVWWAAHKDEIFQEE